MQALLDCYEEAVAEWAKRMEKLNAELVTADVEADLEPSAEAERALFEARNAVASWLQARELMAKKRADLVTYMEARDDAASFIAARSPRPTSQPGYL